MKRIAITLLMLVLVAGYVYAGSSGVANSVTDKTTHALVGGLKDKVKATLDDVITELDSDEDRLDDLEAGAFDAGATFNGAITVVSTNGATTNVIVTVAGVIDGETIGDDTIDDDAIDFTDVTAADFGLGSGISTNYSSVTNFDITIVNGIITVFTSN